MRPCSCSPGSPRPPRRSPGAFARVFMAGVAVAVLGSLAAGCGGDDGGPSGPGGSADVTINIVGMLGSNSYSPSPDTVSVGQTVAWHNGDSSTHTATSNVSGAFDTGNIGGGATSSPITMDTAGTFTYHCSLHPSMTGTLVVE